MKKSIFTLSFATILIVSGIFTSCQSSAEKADKAQEKVLDAKQDLKEAENFKPNPTKKDKGFFERMKQYFE